MTRALSGLLLVALVFADTPDKGWTEGTPAKGMTQLLAPVEPVPVEVPEALAERIEKPTFVFYFSPTCPHCQATIGEVVELSKAMPDLAFLGLATSRSTPEELEVFARDYSVPFPIVIDTPRGFATQIGARSTPTVVVVEPTRKGFQVTDHYGPWFEGAGTIFRMRRDPASAFSHFEKGRYQGEHVCASCHTEEATSWYMSHHAVAYQTLYTQDRVDDPKCVSCHVVGLGEPSGFELGDHGSPLAGVGCEACHSAGGPHDGERVDATTQCATCHDAEHSIDFSVAKGLPHIDHFVANGMTEQEMQARWTALSKGEAPRPLLAFPEGDNVGPDACVSCHEAEVTAWKSSRHAGAMKLLDPTQATQTDCVGCHATPDASGPPPKTVDGFDTDHGVACESCHGPGEAHVASPSKTNIQGLGDSCPECVLNAICTSCHDTEWDPAWNLEVRKEAIRGHK